MNDRNQNATSAQGAGLATPAVSEIAAREKLLIAKERERELWDAMSEIRDKKYVFMADAIADEAVLSLGVEDYDKLIWAVSYLLKYADGIPGGLPHYNELTDILELLESLRDCKSHVDLLNLEANRMQAERIFITKEFPEIGRERIKYEALRRTQKENIAHPKTVQA